MRLAYGDPDELDRLAHKLRARADAVRAHAEDQVRRAAAAQWASDAADTYRTHLASQRAEADRAADGLETAAAALEAHAQEIRELLARIARIEQEVSDWVSNRARDVKDAVEGLVRRVSRGDHLPLPGLPLPPPGDKGWLEVGEVLRRQGVL